MKFCRSCNAENPPLAEICTTCGTPFGIPPGEPSHPLPATEYPARPTGTVPMVIGWICFGLAVVFGLLAMAGAAAWNFAVAASGFFSLFLVLWSVGYVVRAISFLPDRSSRL